MKPYFSILVLLFLSSTAHADCNAPDLDLPFYEGLVHGYQVSPFSGWHDSDSPYYNKPQDEVEQLLSRNAEYIEIDSGGGWLHLQPVDTQTPFHEIQLDPSRFDEKIQNQFIRSEHDLDDYAEPWGQHLSLSSIRGFDLSGDNDIDLMVFGVSPGANVYTGVIAITPSGWQKIIDPGCH